MVLPAHALQGIQVLLKSASNESESTLKAETVFLLYLPLDSSGVSVYQHMGLSAHALQAVQVRLNSASNEGHFNRKPETVFLLDLPKDFSGVFE
jgi:hypothetical protein